jgi:hypothetical protein
MMQSSKEIWQIQADTKGRNDFDFFVTTDNKYGVYFSEIDEYGMMKFVSPVQIWTDRETPRLLFQSRQIKFEYQHGESCYYLEKSDILVLLTPCIHEKYFDLLYILFAFNKKSFSIINAPNFRLTEIDKGVIRQDTEFRYNYDEDVKVQISQDNGKLIDLNLLEWQEIKHIDKTCSCFMKNNR